MNSNALPTVKKVAVIGPECTGKSDLSQFLASHFKTEWVPEYARGYIDHLVRPYEEHDLLAIAHGQLRVEDEYARDSKGILFCDTNLYVIKVWSEVKFGTCAEEILKQIATRHYDLYLLTYVDVPWVDDPQREHPTMREELYQRYRTELKNQPVPFIEIKGEREQRRKLAVDATQKILS
ncbi:AAA family ATPase [Chryseolinea lacunae]|uniref:ATP-binding protein n=1 Tax=Chryseolinea lacunae TaxID=2801331 RepID=A0ABS1KRW1_9BACT|nr:ATP-binding protein [Chryseolinea lacunae]MBL0742179.1 ATP-binding protein [Chryseolinea lacunae]